MSELNKKVKKAVTIGSCPQGKGKITSRNSEKCQRCVTEIYKEKNKLKREALRSRTSGVDLIF